MTELIEYPRGTEMTTPDGIVGYVVSYNRVPAEWEHPGNKSLSIFRRDSNGEPCSMTGSPAMWEPTGGSADAKLLDYIERWRWGRLRDDEW